MSRESLLGFSSRQQRRTDDGELYFGRLDLDGAPFRGRTVPTAPEEEMERRLQRSGKAHNHTFDLSEPDQNAAYLSLLSKLCNNSWCMLLSPPKKFYFKNEEKQMVRIVVHIEWVEYFMEDKEAMP